MTKRFARIAVLGCAMLMLAALACREQPAPPELPPRPIKLFTVHAAGERIALEYTGEVSPVENVDMAFEVSGRINSFPVNEGQKVEKGTLLASLDARDFEASRDSAEARLSNATANFERARVLYEEDVASKQQLDAAERNYEMARAEARKARKAVEDAVLVAPFTGTVAKKYVKDFQNVRKKEPVLVFQSDSALEIVVDAPERDFARMRRGLSMEERNAILDTEVEISALPGRPIDAVLVEFSTTADPVTRTFRATFAFEPPADASVLPGMSAKVRVMVPRERVGASGFMVPANATFIDEQGDSFVWVVDIGAMTVQRRAVDVGGLADDRIQIKRGLAENDTIAFSGVHHLSDGMEVRRYSR
jgi:RND family efflux transporter MFP subunit